MRYSIALLALSLVACGAEPRPAEAPVAETHAGGAAPSAPAPSADPATPGHTPGAPGDTAAETPSAEPGAQFTTVDTHTAKDTHGTKESNLAPTKTEALLKFVVVDKAKGPIEGIVVSLAAPDGKTYYTEETDAVGYAEALVPVGQKYDVVYVSLGRKDISASFDVSDQPKQTIKLTLRYERKGKGAAAGPEHVVLDGVNFDSNKASIRPESFPQLDRVVEYMTHKKKARIQIAGHTDNVGKKEANKLLSEQRAKACRDYLVSKGIAAERIEAVGYGDERPLAPNDTESGRQRNRRIEATDL